MPAAGARYVRHRLTPGNFAATLDEHLTAGDILINLLWGSGTGDLVAWCHDHGVRYVDSCLDQWARCHNPSPIKQRSPTSTSAS